LLSEQELLEIQTVAERLTRPVILKVYKPGSGAAFESDLANIAAQASGVSANRILYQETDQGPFPDKPSVTISAMDQDPIHYCALPQGSEFKPFLEAISWLGKDSRAQSPRDAAAIASVTEEKVIEIIVLMAAMCPHCPGVVRSCLEITAKNSGVMVLVADALEFSDLTSKYKVKSTPTVVINGATTLVGNIGLEELVRNINMTSDPSQLTEILRSMINSGRAEDAADLLLESKNPKAILPLYISGEFSTRMGVLVTLEEALEKDPASLNQIVDELIGLLDSQDVGLRGDTAELLGNIGSEKSIPHLQRLKDDPDDDVKEAANEALEKLNS
jgi:hypothetical protein